MKLPAKLKCYLHLLGRWIAELHAAMLVSHWTLLMNLHGRSLARPVKHTYTYICAEIPDSWILEERLHPPTADASSRTSPVLSDCSTRLTGCCAQLFRSMSGSFPAAHDGNSRVCVGRYRRHRPLKPPVSCAAGQRQSPAPTQRVGWTHLHLRWFVLLLEPVKKASKNQVQ